jgi:hypothetical protein
MSGGGRTMVVEIRVEFEQEQEGENTIGVLCAICCSMRVAKQTFRGSRLHSMGPPDGAADEDICRGRHDAVS